MDCERGPWPEADAVSERVKTFGNLWIGKLVGVWTEAFLGILLTLCGCIGHPLVEAAVNSPPPFSFLLFLLFMLLTLFLKGVGKMLKTNLNI